MTAAPVASHTAQTSEPSEIQSDDAPCADEDEEERARVRIRAAMNIFDAEEIREPEMASQQVPAPDA
jgi:hypothetical protein